MKEREREKERERDTHTRKLCTLSNQSLVPHDDNNDDIYLSHFKRSSVCLSSKYTFVRHIRSVTKQRLTFDWSTKRAGAHFVQCIACI